VSDTVVLFEVRRVQHAPGAAEAKHRWESGQLVPARITLALDVLALDRLEVDETCGVPPRTVAQWEKGLEYPTWEQVCRLAVRTGFGLAWFARPVEHLDVQSGPFFRRAPEGWMPYRADRMVHSFTRPAINRTLGGRRGGTRL
jgi:hypothetical protein